MEMYFQKIFFTKEDLVTWRNAYAPGGHQCITHHMIGDIDIWTLFYHSNKEL